MVIHDVIGIWAIDTAAMFTRRPNSRRSMIAVGVAALILGGALIWSTAMQRTTGGKETAGFETGTSTDPSSIGTTETPAVPSSTRPEIHEEGEIAEEGGLLRIEGAGGATEPSLFHERPPQPTPQRRPEPSPTTLKPTSDDEPTIAGSVEPTTPPATAPPTTTSISVASPQRDSDDATTPPPVAANGTRPTPTPTTNAPQPPPTTADEARPAPATGDNAQYSEQSIRNRTYGPRPGVSPPAGALVIEVGQDLEQLVEGIRDRRTVFLRAGTHRLTGTLEIPDGVTIIGEHNGRTGAVVTGAESISDRLSAQRRGPLFVFDGIEPAASFDRAEHREHCEPDSAGCHLPEQFFLDGVQYRQVSSVDSVEKGTFHLDPATRTLTVADDPQGKLAEYTRLSPLVRFGDDVVIDNLTFQRAAGTLFVTAIGGQAGATGVTIENSAFRQLAGAALGLPTDAVIRGSAITEAGQVGLKAVGVANIVVEDNLLADTNVDGWRWVHEAGATKFVESTDVTVRGNWFRNNRGAGLWSDADNVDHLFEHNLATGNTGSAVFYEISSDAVIRRNIIRDNHHDGLVVSNSHDVVVSGNQLSGNRSAIVLIHTMCRGRDKPNRAANWYLDNITVEGNSIEQRSRSTDEGWPHGKAILHNVEPAAAPCSIPYGADRRSWAVEDWYRRSTIAFQDNTHRLSGTADHLFWGLNPTTGRRTELSLAEWVRTSGSTGANS